MTLESTKVSEGLLAGNLGSVLKQTFPTDGLRFCKKQGSSLDKIETDIWSQMGGTLDLLVAFLHPPQVLFSSLRS